MTEWIDVPVADVQTGDEVKVDGIGERGGKAMNLAGIYWNAVTAIEEKEIVLGACEIPNLTGTGYRFRRSSIVSARRRTPEPSPQPGDWRCRVPGTCPECLAACGCISREVFRASGGWSRDTRTGQPWVMRDDCPVEVAVKAQCGNIAFSLSTASRAFSYASLRLLDEPWADYYKRIGLDVRPVDRRGKR